MADYLKVLFLATVVQAAGTLLVAGLLLALSRSMPSRFLRLWALAWVCRAGGLVALFLAVRGPAPLRGPLVSVYLLAGYLFAFLLWAGCRRLADDRGLRPRDWLRLVLPAGFAVLAPSLVGGPVWRLFPWHAAVLTGLFLLALVPTVRFPRAGPATGRWLVRAALAALAGLFAHYAVVLVVVADRGLEGYEYLAFASLFDVLVETALAFGMVVLAADRTRGLLEGQNRALAAAAAELAAVAGTDPLTGVGNRRRFEQVLAAHAAGPHPGAVAVLDLNDLKRVNDAHGHPAGDAALQLVARALRGRFRITDPVCRTGGDEFVVVMPDATAGELCGRLAGLDRELAGQRLPGADDPADLQVAWGVAPFTADLPAAVAAADRAMYARKRLMKAPVPAAV